MLKGKLLIILFITFSSLLFAQTPEWQWVSQAGGSSQDSGQGITLDGSGNIYTTGHFSETAIFGSYYLSSNGERDIFVAKMDGSGNWLWVTKAGGNHHDSSLEIVIDDSGNSYVIGYFRGTATFGSYSLTSYGIRDIFVAKIDGDGNWLWVVQAGGSSDDYGLDITIDDNGNSYVTGYFNETATFGSYSLTSSGSYDIFVAKIDGSGNWLWATKAGGSYYDKGLDIAIDDNGNSYVTGRFQSTAIFGSYFFTSNGSYDIFVAKLDGDGNWLWTTKAGGSSSDTAYGLVIDNDGNSYVTGCFNETATFGSYFFTSNGSYDIFVAKLDESGNWLWVVQAGGSSADNGSDIAIDDSGNIYTTGYFSETAIFGSYSLTSYGGWDIFVAKMDGNGNWLYIAQAGGNNLDSGLEIAVDNNDNSYVTGYFTETATFGFYSLTGIGWSEIFIAKLWANTSVEYHVIPTKMELSNHPNPFNPTTTISFSVTQNSDFVNLEIYNIKGQKIKTLANNEFTKGSHLIIWNGDDEKGEPVSSGVYLYKLKVNGKMEAVRKCILLK